MQDLSEFVAEVVRDCLGSLSEEARERLELLHPKGPAATMAATAQKILAANSARPTAEEVEIAVVATLMPHGRRRGIYGTAKEASVQYELLRQAAQHGVPLHQVSAWKASDPGVDPTRVEFAARTWQLRKLTLQRYAADFPDDQLRLGELEKDPLLTAICAVAVALFRDAQDSALELSLTLPLAEMSVSLPDLCSSSQATRTTSRRGHSQELLSRARILDLLDQKLSMLTGSDPARETDHYESQLEIALSMAQTVSFGPSKSDPRKTGDRWKDSDPFRWHDRQVKLLEKSAIRCGVISQPGQDERSIIVETVCLLHPELRISRRRPRVDRPQRPGTVAWSDVADDARLTKVEAIDVAEALDSLVANCVGHIVDAVYEHSAHPQYVTSLLESWLSGQYADDLDGEQVFALLLPFLRGLAKQADVQQGPPSPASFDRAHALSQGRRDALVPSLIVTLAPSTQAEVLGLLIPSLWTDRDAASAKVADYLIAMGVPANQAVLGSCAITLAPAHYIVRSSVGLDVESRRAWSEPGSVESLGTLAAKSQMTPDYAGRFFRELSRVHSRLRPAFEALRFGPSAGHG